MTLVSPFLLRGLWGLPLSEFHRGDITTSTHLGRVNAGIARAAAEGKKLVVDDLYRITNRSVSGSASLIVHATGADIVGLNGCGFDMSPCANSGSVRYLLRGDGSSGTYVNLTSSADAGDGEITAEQITVGSGGMTALDLEVGDMVHIMSDKVFIEGGTADAEKQGEIVTVTSVGSTGFTCEPPLADSYSTSDTARVAKLTMHTGSVENLLLIGPGQFTTDVVGDRGLHYVWSKNLRLTGVDTQLLDNGNYLYSCVGLRASEIRWRFDEQNSRTVNQYGFALVNACQDVLVTGCFGLNGKQGIVQTESSLAPGVTRDVLLFDNDIYGTWNYGIAMHTNAEQITVSTSRIKNCNAGMEAGCREFTSMFNEIRFLPNANIGVGIGVNDIADGVYSTGDRIYGGRYAFQFDGNDRPVFVGSAGPRRFRIIDMFADGFANDGIQMVFASGTPGDDIEIHDFKVINAGAGASTPQAVDISGPCTNFVHSGGNYHGDMLSTGGCVLTRPDVSGEFRGRIRYSGDFTAPVIQGAMKRGAAVGYGTATLTWSSISAGSADTKTITVQGAVAGSPASVGAATVLDTGLSMSAFVSAANTVTVKIQNHTSGSITPFSGTATAFTAMTGGPHG